MWKRCEADYSQLPAVRWLVKKDIMQRTYGELAANITAMKKGYAALGYSHKHIALIGVSSVEWIQAYMSIVTSDNAAVPLDSALPAEDLTDLVARSDSEGVFLDPKFAALAEMIKANCPKVRNIWLLSSDAEQGAETVGSLIAAGKIPMSLSRRRKTTFR